MGPSRFQPTKLFADAGLLQSCQAWGHAPTDKRRPARAFGQPAAGLALRACRDCNRRIPPPLRKAPRQRPNAAHRPLGPRARESDHPMRIRNRTEMTLTGLSQPSGWRWSCCRLDRKGRIFHGAYQGRRSDGLPADMDSETTIIPEPRLPSLLLPCSRTHAARAMVAGVWKRRGRSKYASYHPDSLGCCRPASPSRTTLAGFSSLCSPSRHGAASSSAIRVSRMIHFIRRRGCKARAAGKGKRGRATCRASFAAEEVMPSVERAFSSRANSTSPECQVPLSLHRVQVW